MDKNCNDTSCSTEASVRLTILFIAAVFLSGLIGCQSVPERAGSEEGESWSAFQAHQIEERKPPQKPTIKKTPEPSHYYDVPVIERYIALTFDDGPSGWLTPRLLDLLEEHDVRATFFVLGQQAAAFPEIVRRIDADGHEIGNHTWDHRSLDRLSREKARSQLQKTSNIIRALTDRSLVLMRPPYGRTNDSLNRWITDELAMKVVLWSVDSNDWRVRDADLIRHNILTATQSGSIILCHDIHLSTIEAMPGVIQTLKVHGYQFVTVSELIEIGKEIR